jgi:quercetin dioxygenase-like cupin family protein
MRGSIPPGGIVPLHSHADPETFLMESGELDAFAGERDWIRVLPGDVLHVPGDAPHAFRNPGAVPAVTLIVTTARIARFFREVARPSDDPLATFLATAERYGYWNATPEENAAIGITPMGD